MGAGVGYGLGFGVEEQGVLSGVGGGTGGSGVCAQIGLGEGDGERGVGREVQTRVTFTPVPHNVSIGLSTVLVKAGAQLHKSLLDDSNVDRRGRTGTVDLLFTHDGHFAGSMSN